MRRSGKYAYVNGLHCITGWSVTGASSAGRYSASCTPDGSAVSEGNENWTGSIQGVGYDALFPEEDDYAFIGVASAKAGQVVNYEGDVLVEQTTIQIPVAQGGPITWEATIGVQGSLTKTTVTPHLDATRDHAPSAKYGGVRIEATPDNGTFTDLDDIQNITITLRRPAVISVDSGETFREAGNLEADISFAINTDDLDVALYALNAVKRVRIYVSADDYFEFDAIMFTGLSDYRVVRGPQPQMIGYTVNGMWTASRETSATLGQILLPDGSELYGEES
jgi:hypothetical protein